MGWSEGLTIENVPIDFSNAESIAHALVGVDYVVHVAGLTKAKRTSDYISVNVGYTENLLKAATGVPTVKKICYVSSLTACGPSPDSTPITEDFDCKPIAPYGKSKLLAEQLCKAYSSSLPIVVVRPPTVYGPRDVDVLDMVRAIQKGIFPDLGTKKLLSIVYVKDLARGIATAVFHPETAGKTYFITDPSVYTSDEMGNAIADLAGKKPLRFRIPGGVIYILAAIVQAATMFSKKPPILNISRAGELLEKYWVCSAEQFKNDTGFTTAYDLRRGMAETISWYKEHNWI